MHPQQMRCVWICVVCVVVSLLLFLVYRTDICTTATKIRETVSGQRKSVIRQIEYDDSKQKWNNLSTEAALAEFAATAASISMPVTAASLKAVPSFVHQSWKNKDLPPRFIRWFATWEICFPNYEHRLWTDDDNLELVRTKVPDFLEQYLQYKDKIQRADAVRYLYMYHYGGIYSDLDNECLRSFQHLIESSGCGVILGSMRSNREKQYIQNSFMYSRPQHPFWLRVVEEMKERRSSQGVYLQDTVDLTTGPKLLMHAISKHRKVYEGTASPGPICVFPDTYFNPYSWDMDKGGPCKDLNQMTEADLANCKMKHKKAYVIQYHTQSWLAGKV